MAIKGVDYQLLLSAAQHAKDAELTGVLKAASKGQAKAFDTNPVLIARAFTYLNNDAFFLHNPNLQATLGALRQQPGVNMLWRTGSPGDPASRRTEALVRKVEGLSPYGVKAVLIGDDEIFSFLDPADPDYPLIKSAIEAPLSKPTEGNRSLIAALWANPGFREHTIEGYVRAALEDIGKRHYLFSAAFQADPALAVHTLTVIIRESYGLSQIYDAWRIDGARSLLDDFSYDAQPRSPHLLDLKRLSKEVNAFRREHNQKMEELWRETQEGADVHLARLEQELEIPEARGGEPEGGARFLDIIEEIFGRDGHIKNGGATPGADADRSADVSTFLTSRLGHRPSDEEIHDMLMGRGRNPQLRVELAKHLKVAADSLPQIAERMVKEGQLKIDLSEGRDAEKLKGPPKDKPKK